MKKGQIRAYGSQNVSNDCDEISYLSNDDTVDIVNWEQLLEKEREYERRCPDVFREDVYVEVICDVCEHVFLKKIQDAEMDCPYCGHHFNVKDYEELHVTLHDERNAEHCAKLEECAIRMERKVIDNKWENDAKEQLNLAPGTTEYTEYIEDLKEHNPFRSDDDMHESLEDYNENLVTKLYEKAEGQYDIDDVSIKQKNHVEGLKRSMHKDVIASAALMASVTPSKDDDMRAKQLSSDNSILHDDGVSLDEYEDAITDYVLDK